jgi:hypothetical protein
VPSLVADLEEVLWLEATDVVHEELGRTTLGSEIMERDRAIRGNA